MSQTCSSPWYGDCESGWVSNSANDSLDLCSVTSGSTTDWGMGVKAATLHNGAGYSLTLGSTDEIVVVTGTATAIVGSVDVGVRLVFKNSSGSTVGTVQNVQTVGVGELVDIAMQEPKPGNAVAVDAQVAVAGTVGRLAWVTQVSVTSDVVVQASTQQECEDAEEARELELQSDCETNGGSFFGMCDGLFFEDSETCKVSCSWECSKDVTLGDVTCTQGYY